LGIISGPWSDLRSGLATQTVMNGQTPYHEPMRLLTVVEAPRASIDKLVGRHEVLQRFYRNEWVHLVAVDPEDTGLYRYRADGDWTPITDMNIVAPTEKAGKGAGGMSELTLHPMKEIRVIVAGEHRVFVTDLFDKMNATGYTIIGNVAGKGHHGM